MAGSFFKSSFSKYRDGQELRNWSRLSESIEEVEDGELRPLRSKARALRRRLDHVIHVAEGRMASSSARKPIMDSSLNTDWAHRPEPWFGPVTPVGMAMVPSQTPFGDQTVLYHDCRMSELSFRQIRNADPDHQAAFAVRFDVFRFDGSFLSLAIELPQEASKDLGKQHTITLYADIETEAPLEIFGRLNIRHGPNTEQVVREFPPGGGAQAVEFDLAYTNLTHRRVEKMWLDLIFEGPEMNQITVRDLVMTRRPRAEF